VKVKVEDIGKSIRAIRQRKGVTLEALSARSGLSVGFLSQVERGISSLSIVSLYSICKALEIPIPEVFASTKEPSTVTKEMDQPQIRIANSAVTYRYLSGAFPERVNEILINEFPPNYRHPLAPHGGEEFGYVLEGHLLLRIGDEEYPLGPGDSYHFLASKPHGYETSAKEGARVLMVTTQKFIEWHSEVRRRAFEKETR
jgi:transcriptional regulator with XRE-family HTH domain